MPLPTGTWKATVNGAESDFVIDAPNAQGVFEGETVPNACTGLLG